MKNAINRSLWDKNQNQLADLFDTSKQTISYHIINMLKERGLDVNLVAKDYLTTALDGKKYEVTRSWLRLNSSYELEKRDMR